MKLHRPFSRLAVATTVVLFFHFSAFASTTVFVYDSFGPGNTYSTTRWLVEGTAGPHGYQGHAESFVPNISGYLNQVQVATLLEGGWPTSNFFIAQDSGSGIPGTTLESFNNVSNGNGLLTLNSVSTPLLQAGQKYWLCDEPVAPSTYTGWYFNSQGFTGNYAFETTQGSWFPGSSGQTDSVFSISVVPVPEPSDAALVLLGAGLLVARSQRWRGKV